MAVESVEDFNSLAASVEAVPNYVRPVAFAVGVAIVAGDAAGTVLDTYFPVVNVGEHHRTAAVMSKACGRLSGAGSYRLTNDALVGVLEAFVPFLGDGRYHPNIEAMQDVVRIVGAHKPLVGNRVAVFTFIEEFSAPPIDIHDVWLRLHLLSHRRVRPHGVNLDGIFGMLPNVVWTNVGPFLAEDFERVRAKLRAASYSVRVNSVDKFPRMTDYVVPSGVRIADANRVRLGAHLAPGTTVMHEGFVNFNAGTLGASMVEGRISAGVVVGDGSDIGGGASIMGTLSGGGRKVVSIGERSLLGANAGIGISLGNDCVVEAGCYVTAGSKVKLPDGTTVKARELSGKDGLLFRRNSITGALEAVPSGRGADRSTPVWGGLNADLHDN